DLNNLQQNCPGFDVPADYSMTFSKQSTNHPKNRDSLKEILSPQTYIIRRIKEIKDKMTAIENVVEKLESKLNTAKFYL
ncbi:28000_t:CDS:1, partial [Gigaspora margarita]